MKIQSSKIAQINEPHQGATNEGRLTSGGNNGIIEQVTSKTQWIYPESYYFHRTDANAISVQNELPKRQCKLYDHSPEVVAHHEAGHAVLFYLYGYDVQSISIGPKGTGMVQSCEVYPTAYLGTEVRPALSDANYDDFREVLFADMERYSKICIAGYAAEFYFLRRRMPHGIARQPDPNDDFSKIWEQFANANLVLGTHSYGHFILYSFQEQVKREIRKPKVWQTIQEVAKAVLDAPDNKIFLDEVDRICSRRLTRYVYKEFPMLCPRQYPFRLWQLSLITI